MQAAEWAGNMADNGCIFCRIVAGEIPYVKIYDDSWVLAFLDISPVSDGHTLVVPKVHFATLDQCPTDVVSRIADCASKIAPVIVTAVDADGYNVLCNNGSAAGQAVDHIHFHVIPRWRGDKVFARWPAGKYEPGRAEEIADRIRENLRFGR